MAVSASIIFDSKSGHKMEYKIKDIASVASLIDDISVRDYFDIKGIGRLHIRSISTVPLKGDVKRQIVTFRCYWVDTSIPF